ncbi:MAG TPA: CsbD family protein [Solirubrobacteraceae bacterium]|nr:CsbD family protein [Solirubrobacteraceae bacterium]
MSKSATRNQAEGFVDRLAGRVLEAWGALTGQRSKQAKGKAAKGRGRARGATGRAKRRMK